MRKDTVCSADDRLLLTPPDHYGMQGPKGRLAYVATWGKLLSWANQHTKHAQYVYLNGAPSATILQHREERGSSEIVIGEMLVGRVD